MTRCDKPQGERATRPSRSATRRPERPNAPPRLPRSERLRHTLRFMPGRLRGHAKSCEADVRLRLRLRLQPKPCSTGTISTISPRSFNCGNQPSNRKRPGGTTGTGHPAAPPARAITQQRRSSPDLNLSLAAIAASIRFSPCPRSGSAGWSAAGVAPNGGRSYELAFRDSGHRKRPGAPAAGVIPQGGAGGARDG